MRDAIMLRSEGGRAIQGREVDTIALGNAVKQPSLSPVRLVKASPWDQYWSWILLCERRKVCLLRAAQRMRPVRSTASTPPADSKYRKGLETAPMPTCAGRLGLCRPNCATWTTKPS